MSLETTGQWQRTWVIGWMEGAGAEGTSDDGRRWAQGWLGARSGAGAGVLGRVGVRGQKCVRARTGGDDVHERGPVAAARAGMGDGAQGACTARARGRRKRMVNAKKMFTPIHMIIFGDHLPTVENNLILDVRCQMLKLRYYFRRLIRERQK